MVFSRFLFKGAETIGEAMVILDQNGVQHIPQKEVDKEMKNIIICK